ncbi:MULTISPECIES: molybdate ABC transporter substrate-binding protein [unclassified Rathayibacter]|uniref:molybdate ABC transporter substrate-binding protein n=1 Tax=unclassified Rathayibacter TaxID=2609250 RepID=UPI001FB3B5BF|nr:MULTISPECIES: molybdate ABC transporter substrate-binding protein [unclassified Rathayibacter]MCJ1673408.1 molybdate ABC transporter substrate-binding protein [Rathayibacter sp. VKM Ac-2929]MCJ1682844.1 molybdate ABC transporter substrate-binding protein [Rathayibacter sp. VKM Ac-2928]MCJ1687588.1 molybdate ABC transporter substrate-binding protein [Rathayibacter sp. VKM Ac-2927]
MTLPRAAAALLSSAALLAVLAGCSASAPAETATAEASSTPTATSALSGSITVYAAASLKGTFTEIATAFEAEHPGTTVELTFAGSSDLVTQITNGAPADVFASADEKNMAKLTDADLIEGDPVDFATNTLEIAVPPANPAGIASFADLAREGVKTVVCAAQVPCGAATVTVETATGVDLRPVSEESSVTDVLGKVTSGEADAGLVYVTDVAAAGDAVTGIEFPESSQAVNTYPIAPVAGSANPDLAAAFTAYVAGDDGRTVLASAGFGAP